MIERHGGDFDGLIGFVGAESIGDVPMRDFLTHVNTSHPDLSLADFVAALSGELSTEWQRHLLDLCLWVFVAGYEEGEARFWWSCNGELSPNGRYVDIGPCFRAVDDLDKHAIPCYQREHAYATREEVLANVNLFFRNGALVPAAPILDRYTAMIGDIYRGGFPGFGPISTLNDYVYLVRMRQEFAKRPFNPSKGIYRATRPPIGGEVFVRSVDPSGTLANHGKPRVQC